MLAKVDAVEIRCERDIEAIINENPAMSAAG
jgi:hypothetical protein